MSSRMSGMLINAFFSDPESSDASCCSISVSMLAELIAILSFFLIGAACAIPSYHFGAWAIDLPEPWGYIHVGIYDQPIFDGSTFGACNARTFGIVFAQVVSLWAVAFSIAVILLKWIIVGKYRAGERQVGSVWWYRWWYIDRLIEIWEATVGPFVLDTWLIIAFYKLLGADVSWTSSINSFFREFDLVHIGSSSAVSGHILPRLLKSRYKIFFDKIRIEESVEIGQGSVIEPGVKIESFASIQPNSRVVEQSTIRKGIWCGNPLHRWSRREIRKDISVRNQIALQTLKIISLATLPILLSLLAIPSIWIFWWVDIFEFCVLDGNPHWHLPVSLDQNYFTLLNLTAIWLGSVFTLIPFTVALKWILSGYTRPGEYIPNLFTKWRRWYLGLLSSMVFNFPFRIIGQFQVMNLWLCAMGASIAPGVHSINFLLVHIEDAHFVSIGEGSFLSACTFKPDMETFDGRHFKCLISIGKYCAVGFRTIVQGNIVMEHMSSLGWLSHVRSKHAVDENERKDIEDNRAVEPYCVKQGFVWIGQHIQGGSTHGSSFRQRKEVLNDMNKDSDLENSRFFCEKLFYRGRFVICFCLSNLLVFLVYYTTVIAAYNVSIELGKHAKDVNVYTLMFGLFIFIWAWMLIITQVVYKWITVFRYRPETFKLQIHGANFSLFLRQIALHQLMNISLSIQYLFGHILKGTKLQILFLRAIGVQISWKALVLTNELLFDYDLIQVDDNVVLDHQAQLTGHVFENFRLRLFGTTVANDALLGPFSYAHCGNHIGSLAELKPLSKTLSGGVASNQVWAGVPARRVRDRRSMRKRRLNRAANE